MAFESIIANALVLPILTYFLIVLTTLAECFCGMRLYCNDIFSTIGLKHFPIIILRLLLFLLSCCPLIFSQTNLYFSYRSNVFNTHFCNIPKSKSLYVFRILSWLLFPGDISPLYRNAILLLAVQLFSCCHFLKYLICWFLETSCIWECFQGCL